MLEYIDGQPLRGPLPAGRGAAAGDADCERAGGGAPTGHSAPRSEAREHHGHRRSGSWPSARRAKLLDFGLAKLIAADADVTRTTEGIVLGTAAYMSPEQAEGSRSTRARTSSASARCCTRCCPARGRSPDDTAAQVFSAVLRDDPARCLRRRPRSSASFDDACQKEPADRFQTMAEVKAALEEGVDGDLGEPQPSIAVLPFANMSARQGERVFQRRPRRRDHQCAGAHSRPEGHRAHVRVRVSRARTTTSGNRRSASA